MAKYTNLINEIVLVLEKNGKSPKDILWVGSYNGKFAMNWDAFKEKFSDVYYDPNSDRVEVAIDLVVVGDNWWLERESPGIYADSCNTIMEEWWSFKKKPELMDKTSPIEFVVNDTDRVIVLLEEIN